MFGGVSTCGVDRLMGSFGESEKESPRNRNRGATFGTVQKAMDFTYLIARTPKCQRVDNFR